MLTPMRRPTARFLLVTLAALLPWMPVSAGRAQQAPPHSMPPGIGNTSNDHEDNALAARMAMQQAKGQNTDRQKRLVNDTDRLLALATELKQQVDHTDKNTLSVDVIKKADEIEKLAHSVKERMKG